MNPLSNPEVEAKYRRLGFASAELSLKLTVGGVSVHAVEHLWKGVVLTFERFTSRSMALYEVPVPEKCSVEQIAGLIYANIALNHRDCAPAWKSYFAALDIHLFQ